MRRKLMIVGCLALGLVMAPVFVLTPGCGGNDFLGLEDYQRDLLIGGLAIALLGSAPTGGGIDCWDLNGNGVNDADEDTNGDGLFNALDCVANAGLLVPSSGIACWDLNENGEGDADEDTNGDGVFDVNDCRGETGADGADGPDGLSCWDLNGDGVKDANEDVNRDGSWDARDCQGAAGADGEDGADGQDGADGPDFFDIFIDDFFEQELFSASSENPLLPVNVIRIDEPVLRFAEESPIAYRVAIPPRYQVGNDVTMRMFFYRTGTSDGDCFVMTLDSRRLRNQGGIEVYGDNCDGKASADCGRRWIRFDRDDGDVSGNGVSTGILVVLDLPLNTASGLNLERDLSGDQRLAPGDFLAFEINKSSKSNDSRAYEILGVEFFESRAGSASLSGAEVFFSADAVTCNDCQPNGIDDEIDIDNCPENDLSCLDCNNNRIPDGCEIRDCPDDDVSCQDCNNNGILDECDLCIDEPGLLSAGGGGIAGTALPFTFLQTGFTQELYGTAFGFMGGIAFAPDGDVLVTDCGTAGSGSGGTIRRFDAQSTVTTNGGSVHTFLGADDSNVGCGITNHPDGTLYSNTVEGVSNLSPADGSELRDLLGAAGNGLGITVDPQTCEIVYVGAECPFFGTEKTCTIYSLDTTDGSVTTYSSLDATDVAGVDGIYFDPTGEFLFMATRAPGLTMTILDRAGDIVQNIPMSAEADGIAFHGTEGFVLTVNTDGTITRFDFPGNDFTQTPIQSAFASGGFRCDLSQVGADGCFYLTQDGTRFADGTESGDNSVVRICGGFSPPIPTGIVLTPLTGKAFVGDTHTVTVDVTVSPPCGDDEPLEGTLVTFVVLTGPNQGESGTGTTNSAGSASFTYSGFGGSGVDSIQAWFEIDDGQRFSNIVNMEWNSPDCSQDCNHNGIPDECEPDCNGNGIPDDCDGGCECEVDEDCDDGDPCTTDACDGICFHFPVCPEGACMDGQCVECASEEDCPSGYTCLGGFCYD